MLYVGLDVHSKQITVGVLNSSGQVHQRLLRGQGITPPRRPGPPTVPASAIG